MILVNNVTWLVSRQTVIQDKVTSQKDTLRLEAQWWFLQTVPCLGLQILLTSSTDQSQVIRVVKREELFAPPPIHLTPGLSKGHICYLGFKSARESDSRWKKHQGLRCLLLSCTQESCLEEPPNLTPPWPLPTQVSIQSLLSVFRDLNEI